MAETITFYGKEVTECPVCMKQFRREQLHSGRGRLIAKELNKDLRRVYEPSNKYGDIYPLAYSVMVCPECYFSAFPGDFEKLKPDEISRIGDTKKERISSIQAIFPDLDFISPRRLKEGAASYYLAMLSYEHLNKDKVPTIRQALSSLRAAWLFSDLHAKYPADNFDYMSRLFYRKAAFFYGQAIEAEFSAKERISETPGLGPDLDKNYGFDGVLYVYALLEFKYGPDTDKKVRIERLQKAKTYVGRIFGMGKSNKNKPDALLQKAHDLYDELAEYLKTEGKDV